MDSKVLTTSGHTYPYTAFVNDATFFYNGTYGHLQKSFYFISQINLIVKKTALAH